MEFSHDKRRHRSIICFDLPWDRISLRLPVTNGNKLQLVLALTKKNQIDIELTLSLSRAQRPVHVYFLLASELKSTPYLSAQFISLSWKKEREKIKFSKVHSNDESGCFGSNFNILSLVKIEWWFLPLWLWPFPVHFLSNQWTAPTVLYEYLLPQILSNPLWLPHSTEKKITISFDI